MTRAALLLSLLLAGPAAAQGGLGGPSQKAKTAKQGQGLRFKASKQWKRDKKLNTGEYAAWRLGLLKTRKLRVSLYRHGPGKTKQQQTRRTFPKTLARWARSWLGPEKKPLDPKDKKVVRQRKLKLKGIRARVVEVRGTCRAPRYPGDERPPLRRGWSGLYAHLVGPDGVWTVVLIGPAKQVGAWRKSFVAFVKATTVGKVKVRPDPREKKPKSRPTKPKQAR